jgi:hypothetical protein
MGDGDKTYIGVVDKSAEAQEQQIGMMTERDVRNHIGWIKRCVQHTDEFKKVRDPRQTAWLQYEKFVHNFDYMFDKLETLFDRVIAKRTRDKLQTKYSMGSNRERAAKATGLPGVRSGE